MAHPLPPSLVLRHAVVVMRHGDRSPISNKLGNTALDVKFWRTRLPSEGELEAWSSAHPVHGPTKRLDHPNNPLGQLTTLGARQCRDVGAAVAARLQEHAPHLDATSAPTARSTNMRRTVQTAQCFLSGLGAPVGTVVHVREWLDETLVPNVNKTPALGTALKGADVTAEESNAIDAPELRARLVATLGFTSPSAVPVSQVREVLVCLSAHSQPLPSGLTADDVHSVEELDARVWARRYRPVPVARLGMGALLHELRSLLTSIAAGERAGGVDVFACHDTSLVAMLCAMDAFDERPVGYASSLLLELAEDDLEGTFFVRTLLNFEPIVFGGELGAPECPHGSEWVELTHFGRGVLCNATEPAEHATLAKAVAASAAIGNATGSAAEQALADLLTGRQEGGRGRL